MRTLLLMFVTGALAWTAEPEPPALLTIRRIYVDRLSGNETAAQIRDMIINTLQSSKLFLVTENPDRADAMLKGSAEDTVFTDSFQSSEGINARASIGGVTPVTTSGRRGTVSLGVSENESTKINERKHEAVAAVRLVNKDGDVIWATTQESLGAKFRGASADVADRVVKQLIADIEKARNPSAPGPLLTRPPAAQ